MIFRKSWGLHPAFSSVGNKTSIDLNRNRFVSAETSCYLCLSHYPFHSQRSLPIFLKKYDAHLIWNENVKHIFSCQNKRGGKKICFYTCMQYNLPYIRKNNKPHSQRDVMKVLTPNNSYHTAIAIQLRGASQIIHK